MGSEVLITLKCPSCAGPLSLAEGDTHTICPSCDSGLLISSAVRSYVLPSGLTGMQALRTVRRKLESLNPGVAGRSRVGKPVLFYVPYWRITCQASGYILGIEPVYREEDVQITSSDGYESGWSVIQTRRKIRTGSDAVEREIQLSGSVNISGADLTPLGIPSLSSRAQMSMQGMAIQRKGLPPGLQILEGRNMPEGVFVDPSVSLSEACRQGEEYLVGLASSVGRGLEQRWEFSVVTGHRNCLIYYPLWVIDFECDSRSFQAVIDGVSGNILRGRFPGRELNRVLIAAGIGILWAGILPGAIDYFIGLAPGGTPSPGSGNCLLAGIIVLAALAVGSVKFLGILQSVDESGSDHVI